MTRKKLDLEAVLKKFPNQTTLIHELYMESDSFRSLCEDFLECQEVIERLKSSTTMVGKGYLQEYEILLDELEQELVNKLVG